MSEQAAAPPPPGTRSAAEAGCPAQPPPPVLRRLQRGLEALYRIEEQPDVRAFVVDAPARDDVLGAASGVRRPREQLLVASTGDTLELALFIDPAAVANLEANDPAAGLGAHNAEDFCLVLEGISHFVYVSRCAARDRPVSALELELQAEVDKFVIGILIHDEPPQVADWVHRLLFEAMRLAPELSRQERERYAVATQAAERYARSLLTRFMARDRTGDMLPEVRRFYRMGLPDKLAFIRERQAA